MRNYGKLVLFCTVVWLLATSSWFFGREGRGVCRAETLPDPTRPPAVFAQPPDQAQAPSSGNWEVTSILVSPGRRVAIINGQRHQEGDTVAGAYLLKIDSLAVTLRKNGREFHVGLGGSRIKKPVAASRKKAMGQ